MGTSVLQWQSQLTFQADLHRRRLKVLKRPTLPRRHAAVTPVLSGVIPCLVNLPTTLRSAPEKYAGSPRIAPAEPPRLLNSQPRLTHYYYYRYYIRDEPPTPVCGSFLSTRQQHRRRPILP